MKNLLVSLLLLIFSIASSAQTVDSYTGNLVYTTSNTSFSNPPPDGWANHVWSGFVGTNSTGQGFSGGNTPGWNANTGTFMFGYTQRTISYSTPVNIALSNAGTGIQVTGLRYSWEYINQDYSRGNLSGNINLTNNTGQVVQNYNYSMPRTTNGWTTMSGTEIFSTQYAPSSLGSLNVSFNGKDDRYWAGYYGPQIRDINVGLTYNVPPPPPVPTDFLRWIKLTNENGDFTLSKAGVVRYGANGTYSYQNFEPGTYSCSNGVWGKDPIGGVYKECDLGSNTSPTPATTIPKTTTANSSLPLLDPVTTPTTTQTTTQTTNTGIITDTTGTPQTSYTSTSGSTGSTNTQVVDAQITPQQTTSTTTSSPATNTVASNQQATVAQSTPNATQTKAGDVSDSGGGSSKTTVSLSSVLSMISSNQDKTAALEKSVVQSADAQAFSAGEAAKQSAEKIAGEAQSQSASAGGSLSIAIQMGASQSFSGPTANGAIALQGNLQSNTVVNAARMEQSIASTAVSQQTSNSSGSQSQSNTTSTSTQDNANSGYQFTIQPPKYETAKSENNYTAVTTQSTLYQSQASKQEFTVAAITPSISYNLMTPIRPSQQIQIETPTLEGIKFGHKGPVDNAIEEKSVIMQTNNISQQAESVKKNVQNNELAGGVTIESIAKQPANYAQYFTMIPDVAFYEPKEIYKNQKTIDNARVLRGLTSGSDAKHQEMINQQYKLGN